MPARNTNYFLSFIAILVLAGVLFGFLTFQKAWQFSAPQTVRLELVKGTSVRQVAKRLHQHGVIQNPIIFEMVLRYTGEARLLKAGEYDIVAGSRMTDIIKLLVSGKTVRYGITFPEGLTIRDVCQKFFEKSFMTLAECDVLVRDVSFLHEANGAQNLEGYLFPDTYLFDKHTTPRQMVQAMVDGFYARISPTDLQAALQKGLTLHQWVTLASLVEKETGEPSERPLIAGVFFNRLRVGMPLQTDPAVIYGVPNFNGNLTRAHLQTDSPYNTYTRAGLPVGPIANPGFESLKAVLQPTETEAFYFVAKGAGKHYFSKSLEQHNRAVQYFQLHRGLPPEPGEEEKVIP